MGTSETKRRRTQGELRWARLTPGKISRDTSFYFSTTSPLVNTSCFARLKGNVSKTLNDRNAVMNMLTAIENLKKSVCMSVSWIPREENLAGIYLSETASL